MLYEVCRYIIYIYIYIRYTSLHRNIDIGTLCLLLTLAWFVPYSADKGWITVLVHYDSTTAACRYLQIDCPHALTGGISLDFGVSSEWSKLAEIKNECNETNTPTTTERFHLNSRWLPNKALSVSNYSQRKWGTLFMGRVRELGAPENSRRQPEMPHSGAFVNSKQRVSSTKIRTTSLPGTSDFFLLTRQQLQHYNYCHGQITCSQLIVLVSSRTITKLMYS